MQKLDLNAVLGSLLVVALFVAPGDASAQQRGFDVAKVYKVGLGDSPRLGSATAPVTIVEYSDFYCPHCRRANHKLRTLAALYPGQVRVVFKNSLLDAEDGTLAAEAGMAAAAQGMFWPYHDRLFAGRAPASIDGLAAFADEVGLDGARFRRDMTARRFRDPVVAEHREAVDLGVNGLPVFFVNGRPILGNQPLGVFLLVVDGELARAAKLREAGTKPDAMYAALTAGGLATAGPIKLGADDNMRPGLSNDARYVVPLGPPSRYRGAKQPLVTIVEFSDFNCGYCRKVRPVLERLVAEYDSDVGVSYRYFPLAEAGELAAEAATAAESAGAFWKLHDNLFKTGWDTRSDLVTLATASGVNAERLQSALSRRSHSTAVLRDIADGARLGVQGTPSLFVNGRAVIGYRSYAELKVIVDQEIKAARAKITSGTHRADIYRVTMEANKSAPPQPTPKQEEPEGIVLDPVDYHIATLLACRQSDAETAERMYREIKDKRRRRMIRSDCKRLGIKLPK